MVRRQPNDLRSALILAKCSKRKHNDCRKIRDALISSSSGYIQKAYTTNAEIRDETWCVAASALVPGNRAKVLERALRQARTGGSRPVTVKRLLFLPNAA